MILLVDNYDSFSFNLFQMIGEIEPDIHVIRNDEMDIEEISALQPECIILSPGPGHPSQAGIIEKIIAELGDRIPILGVCLGHQAICEVFDTPIIHAPVLMHGKQSTLEFDENHFLFKNVQNPLKVARYHSLAADPKNISNQLSVLAFSEDDQIMAVEHRDYPIIGLQFHPESVLTPQGRQILKNYIEKVKKND